MSVNEIIQLMGVLYFILGLGFLFNKKFYISLLKDFIKDDTLIFIIGFIVFILGFVMLLFFNSFAFSKEGLVTIISWIVLVKGSIILLFPKKFTKIAKVFVKKKYFDLITFSVIIFSVLLMYCGFIVL